MSSPIWHGVSYNLAMTISSLRSLTRFSLPELSQWITRKERAAIGREGEEWQDGPAGDK
jgi:hypothetical protein